MSAPAILIQWHEGQQAWEATAIMPVQEQLIHGESTRAGHTPADALQQLLAARFGILVDQDCPATLVSLAPATIADIDGSIPSSGDCCGPKLELVR